MDKDRTRPQVHLITGGCGYPGFNLAKKLAELGHKVRLFDVKESVWPLPENVEFVKVRKLHICFRVTNLLE